MFASKRLRKAFRWLLVLLAVGMTGLVGLSFWQRQQPGYYWYRAQRAAQKGDVDRQEFYLLQLARLQPGNADAHLALAELYAAEKRPGTNGRQPSTAVSSRALEHLRTAADLRPGDAGLQLKLMMAYLRSGRAQAAVEAAWQALALGSEDEGALAVVAAAALQSHDVSAAVKVLNRVPEDKRNSSFVLLALQTRTRQSVADQAQLQALFSQVLARAGANTPAALSTLKPAERSALEELLLAAAERGRTVEEIHERLHVALSVLEKLALVETAPKQQLALAERAAQLLATAQEKRPVSYDAVPVLRDDRAALQRRFVTLAQSALDAHIASPNICWQAAGAAFDRGDDIPVIDIVRQGLKSRQAPSEKQRSELLQLEAAALQRLILRGRYREAQPYIGDLLKDEKTAVWGHFVAGIIAEKEGRIKDAENAFTAARQGAGDNVIVNAALMNLLFQLGRYEEVAPLLEELDARWDALTLDESEWVERRLGGRAGIHLVELHVYLALDRYDEALPHSAALEGTSREPAAIRLLVRYHWQHPTEKEQKLAQSLLRQGREKFPDDAPLILCAAEIDQKLGKPESALATVRSGLKRLPSDRKLREAEVSLLCEARQWTEAQEAAQRLGGETPGAEVCLWLSRLFYRSRWFAAARYWAERMPDSAGKPQTREARLLLAEISRHEGQAASGAGGKERLTEARDRYVAILADQPDNLMVANNLAWLWAVDFDQPKEALNVIRRFRERLETERPPLPVIDTFVLVYRKTGELNEARKLLERALEQDSGAALLHRALGQVHLDAGHSDAARASLEMALSLGLPDPLAKETREQLQQLEAQNP